MFKKGDIVKFKDRDSLYQITDIDKRQEYIWIENVIDSGERILTSAQSIKKHDTRTN